MRYAIALLIFVAAYGGYWRGGRGVAELSVTVMLFLSVVVLWQLISQ